MYLFKRQRNYSRKGPSVTFWVAAELSGSVTGVVTFVFLSSEAGSLLSAGTMPPVFPDLMALSVGLGTSVSITQLCSQQGCLGPWVE